MTNAVWIIVGLLAGCWVWLGFIANDLSEIRDLLKPPMPPNGNKIGDHRDLLKKEKGGAN